MAYAHLISQLHKLPLGPVRRQMWNHQFAELEELVTQNLIPEAAAHISGIGMLPHRMPMLYQVWFECILGRMCIATGHYETALKQLEYAKSVWEGPAGWKSGDSSVGGVKNKESHDRMIAESLERCKKGLAGELAAVRLPSAGSALDAHLSDFLVELESRH